MKLNQHSMALADYVVVGQRGIGLSKPNTICESRSRGGGGVWAQCHQYWESRGLDLEGLNVIEAAHDVADVARALGYDSIVVVGSSFGSRSRSRVQRSDLQLSHYGVTWQHFRIPSYCRP